MNRNISALVFALAVMIVYFGVSPGAAAQGQNGCVTYVVCALYSFGQPCAPPMPASAFNCFGIPFEFESECEVQNFLCPPAAAASETCTSGCVPAPAGPANAPATPTAGHPISLATGNTYIRETDVSLPGLSGGLTLARVWNSLWPATQTAYQIGLFGPNWRSTFEERVFVGGDHYMKYARSDGSFWSFGFSSYGVNGPNYLVAAPANVSATLAQGPTNWTITFQNGEQKTFDNSTGHLLAIIDRNGNTTQLSYDSVGRLVTVTDPVSRHLYFAYGNGSSYLVTGVTSDAGLSLSYSYDSQGRLIQVTEPDLSTLSFQYNSQSLITLVTDSIGHTLESHTYDSSGRGLTSSQANGVGAVTLSY